MAYTVVYIFCAHEEVNNPSSQRWKLYKRNVSLTMYGNITINQVLLSLCSPWFWLTIVTILILVLTIRFVFSYTTMEHETTLTIFTVSNRQQI